MSRLRAAVARTRPARLGLLELSGLAAIILGVGMVYRPAGLIVGGVLAVAAAFALERGEPR